MSELATSGFTAMLFVCFGIFGAWRGWHALGRAKASLAWPATHGEIVGSRVEIESNGADEYRRAVITYRYNVGGTVYQSGRVFFGDSIALYWDKPRQQRLAAYPAGQPVVVSYDPATPHEAVLDPGPNWATYLALYGPACVALLGLIKLLSAA